MEMGDMHFMTLCQFLKDVMVAGRYRVVDIILSGNKEDFHTSQISGIFVISG
jgi:ADP-glucose pyrophosphorylase